MPKAAVSVKVQPGQSPDSAYRQFSKKVAAEEIFQEIKQRERYIKPSKRRYEAAKLRLKTRRRVR